VNEEYKKKYVIPDLNGDFLFNESLHKLDNPMCFCFSGMVIAILLDP